MEYTFGERLSHAWNAFMNKDSDDFLIANSGPSNYYNPNRYRLSYGNERSVVASIYNRIAMDVAAISIHHVRVDENKIYSETIDSKLDRCLNVSANKDQTGRAFVQDLVMSMFDEGCVAAVPVDIIVNNKDPSMFIIETMRVGKIIEWYNNHIKVLVFNELKQDREEIIVDKKRVAIIENPLYSIMNEPNSVARRLVRKINLLDAQDEKSGSGKLDLIIQLPYLINSQRKSEQAEQRRKQLEEQLANSKYGIAYTDGTEKITQLGHSLENNLQSQIEYLTRMLQSQLGMDEDIFTGKANEQTMLNYYTHTIEPVLSAIRDEFDRKFISERARSHGQAIRFYRDPFKLVPVNNIAEIADKFTRNAILSSNEIRAIIGYKPSDNQDANELRNKNLYKEEEQQQSNDVQVNNQEIIKNM